jgi:hypothetical protein
MYCYIKNTENLLAFSQTTNNYFMFECYYVLIFMQVYLFVVVRNSLLYSFGLECP